MAVGHQSAPRSPTATCSWSRRERAGARVEPQVEPVGSRAGTPQTRAAGPGPGALGPRTVSLTRHAPVSTRSTCATSRPRNSSASSRNAAASPVVRELVRAGSLGPPAAGRRAGARVHVLRRLLGRGDQHDIGAQLHLEQPGQQRVMGAAQDDRVDACPPRAVQDTRPRPPATPRSSCRPAPRAPRTRDRRRRRASAPRPDGALVGRRSRSSPRCRSPRPSRCEWRGSRPAPRG